MNNIIGSPPIIDVSYIVSEKWIQSKPKMGDHIRVKRKGGLYAHHGIYVSDNEVIHFTGKDDDSILDWSKPEVISSDLDDFLKGGVLEVKEYSDEEFQDLYSPEQIVSYARACLGDKGYNLVFNNCEHFANVCTLGRFRSIQVERVLLGKLPNEEGANMGFLGKIGNAIKNFFGGGSSSSGGSRSTTTYEPDKVKVAQIEADTKIKLADMEIDRIKLMKQAKIDILQFETDSNIALEEARAKGFTVMAQTIVAMQEKINDIAEKRFSIIANGSFQVVKEIEDFYAELGKKIDEDNYKYSTEKLPQLLSILEKYDEGTPAHTLYLKRIEQDMNSQTQAYLMQIEAIQNRQAQIINDIENSKNKIIEQTGQITAGLLENINNQVLALNSTKSINGEKEATSLLDVADEKLSLQKGE